MENERKGGEGVEESPGMGEERGVPMEWEGGDGGKGGGGGRQLT